MLSPDVFAPGPIADPGQSDRIQTLVVERLEEDLIRAAQVVADRLDPAAPDDLRAVASWLNAMALWEQLPSDRRRAVMADPSFRFFLHAVLKLGQAAEPQVRVPDFATGLSDVLWAAALGRVETWSGGVRLDGLGGLRAVPARRYVEFGKDRAHASARVRLAGDRAVFVFDDGLTVQIPVEDIWGPIDTPPDLAQHGYEIKVAAPIGASGLAAFTRDPWLRVKLTGTNQRGDGAGFLDRDDESYPADPDLTALRSAEAMIAQMWPEEARDIATFVKIVAPYRDASPNHTAFTVSSRQGAIFIGSAPPLPTAEMILHEKAHVKLRQIQKLDPLLRDPLDDTLRVPVPWRPDPRPIPGILEGLYVFAHVGEFYRRVARAAGSVEAAARQRQLSADLNHALGVLQAHARLTDMGRVFLDAMTVWVDDLSGQEAARRVS